MKRESVLQDDGHIKHNTITFDDRWVIYVIKTSVNVSIRFVDINRGDSICLGRWLTTDDNSNYIGWDNSAVRGREGSPHWWNNDPPPAYVWFEVFMRVLGEVAWDHE